jgi:hypothetical protein
MQIVEAKREVKNIRRHLKEMDDHLRRAREIAHFFEESLLDVQENDLTYTLDYFEDAVARLYKFVNSPPRL